MNGFGSGMLMFFFTDIIDMQPFTIFNVSINDTVFEANYDFTHQPPVTCFSDLE